MLVSAFEHSTDPNDPDSSPRFVGAANIAVSNITPHGPPYDANHGVTSVVTVDWDSPIDIVTEINVLDAKPEYTGV